MTEENRNVKEWDHVSSLRDKLQSVTTEIDSVKNSFAKGAEDLARIQSMLDIGDLEGFTSTIERYEGQIAEAERGRMEAADGAQKYSEELEKEKERLIKLWDAYKNQEEELSTTERKIAEYEEKTRMAESSKQQLDEDYNARINILNQQIQENQDKVQKFEEYQNRVNDFDNVRNRLEGEIHELKEQTNNKDTTITTLEQQVSELKEYEKTSEFKTKYEELNVEYGKEKERLTKLYQLYEETDSECKRLQKENHNWQQWFNSNKEIFDKLFSAAPSYQVTNTVETPPTGGNMTSNPPNEAITGIDKPKSIQKKKKKLRIKK